MSIKDQNTTEHFHAEVTFPPFKDPRTELPIFRSRLNNSDYPDYRFNVNADGSMRLSLGFHPAERIPEIERFIKKLTSAIGLDLHTQILEAKPKEEQAAVKSGARDPEMDRLVSMALPGGVPWANSSPGNAANAALPPRPDSPIPGRK